MPNPVMDSEEVRNIAQLAAEVAVGRVMEEFRKDLSKNFERLGLVELTVFGPNRDAGLVGEIAAIKTARELRGKECESKFNEIRTAAAQPGKAVNRWRYMMEGAALLAVTAAGTATFVLEMWRLLEGK